MWWGRTTLALFKVMFLLQVAVSALSLVGVPKIELFLQVAGLGLMGFWAVMAGGRRVAFRYANPRRPDGPEVDYHDPGPLA